MYSAPECWLSVVSLAHDILNSLCLMFLHFFSSFSYFLAAFYFGTASKPSRKHKEVARSINKKIINGEEEVSSLGAEPQMEFYDVSGWSSNKSSFPPLRDLIVRIFYVFSSRIFHSPPPRQSMHSETYTRRAGKDDEAENQSWRGETEREKEKKNV